MSDPAPSTPTPVELETLCVELARGAAALVHDTRRADLTVATKSTATDLVTDVDRATEQWLRHELAARRPADRILGEEGGEDGGTNAGTRGDGGGAGSGDAAVRWLLDPVDGTVNFVLGLPMFAVSVAAEVDGEVRAGAVANPSSGELFHARLGGGAHLDGTRLHGPREVALERAVIATGFGYDAALRSRQGAVVTALLPHIGDIRRMGSAALDLCFLAAGRVDGYFEAGLNLWDYAAGGLIAREAGCTTSGLRGNPVSGRMFAAAGPQLAAPLGALLESLDADRVR